MSITYSIKKEAKGRLSNNNWGKAILITLICSLLYTVEHFLSSLFNKITHLSISLHVADKLALNPIIGIITRNIAVWTTDIILFIVLFWVAFPLTLGITKWAYSVAHGESPRADEIFYYFTSKSLYARAVKFSFLLIVRLVVLIVLCMLPGLFVSICSAFIDNINFYIANLVLGIGMCLLIIGFIAALILINRYFLAPYLFVIDDEADPSRCIKASWAMMNGYVMKVIGLILSFILWFVLCIFVIPAFYVGPYVMISQAVCAKWLIDLKIKQKQETL